MTFPKNVIQFLLVHTKMVHMYHNATVNANVAMGYKVTTKYTIHTLEDSL